MGKIPGLEYKSPHNALLVARGHTASAAAKAQATAPKLVPTVEPAAVPVERVTKVKVVPVTNTGAVTNAARQSRWRSKQDVVALRGQAKERMKGRRARPFLRRGRRPSRRPELPVDRSRLAHGTLIALPIARKQLGAKHRHIRGASGQGPGVALYWRSHPKVAQGEAASLSGR
jgi:hypothetical protein